jgi:hypothetical protein
MSAHAEVSRSATAELRLSLGLASLAAALCHVMAAAHLTHGVWPAGAPWLAMAAIQGATAAGLAFTDVRWIVAPAAALNATIVLAWAASQVRSVAVTVPDALATLTEVAFVAGAVALLLGARQGRLSAWSKVAQAAFLVAALTGFGHLH